MGVLEQVMQMREQGMSDSDIVSQLQEQGANPKTISDSLNQANIKSAVGGMEESIQPGMQYNAEDIPVPQNATQYLPGQVENAEDLYIPQTQTPTQQYSYQSPSPQEYNYGESYQQPQYSAAQYSAGTDADTMVEIAQQVFGEKIKKIQNQVEELNEFRALYQVKTDSIYERLKRIEAIIDRLQSAILEKVGSYGGGIESVKKELSMMQDTYGKILNVVSDKNHSTHQTHQTFPAPAHQQVSNASEHKAQHKTSHTISKKHSKKKK